MPVYDIFTILAATIRDVSFWTGLVTVFAFSQGRFNEKQIDEEHIDPPLPIRYFTSRFRYYMSSFVFAGTYVFLYVSLIVIGALPMLQDILQTLFGSLSGTGPLASDPDEAAPPIGTPAWAAMVIMVVAPTVPWVRRLETSFRLWLQEFSDTPFKARGLAEEMIQAMLSSAGSPSRLEHASESALIAVFDGLEDLRQELTGNGRTMRDRDYRVFFARNGEILTKTVDQFRAIRADVAAMAGAGLPVEPSDRGNAHSPSTPPTYRSQMVVLVRRLARLLACALLYAESEEYSVRERLRAMPWLSKFAQARFQFTRAQVLLGLLVIASSAVITGPLTAFVVHSPLTPAQLAEQFQIWGARGLIMAVAFMLPLSLAAAVRLYLMDLAVHGRGDGGWQRNLTTVVLAFIGCFGLSALPIVAFEAYQAGHTFTTTTLTRALLWAVPPAIVNAAFVVLSDVRWGPSPARNAVLDFLTFAALGGISAVLAKALFTVTSLHHAENFDDFMPFFLAYTPFMVTVTMTSGLNGAMQCAVSRVLEAEAQVHAAEPVHAPDLSGAVGLPTR